MFDLAIVLLFSFAFWTDWCLLFCLFCRVCVLLLGLFCGGCLVWFVAIGVIGACCFCWLGVPVFALFVVCFDALRGLCDSGGLGLVVLVGWIRLLLLVIQFAWVPA